MCALNVNFDSSYTKRPIASEVVAAGGCMSFVLYKVYPPILSGDCAHHTHCFISIMHLLYIYIYIYIYI